jgi:hypothetical protein
MHEEDGDDGACECNVVEDVDGLHEEEDVEVWK